MPRDLLDFQEGYFLTNVSQQRAEFSVSKILKSAKDALKTQWRWIVRGYPEHLYPIKRAEQNL